MTDFAPSNPAAAETKRYLARSGADARGAFCLFNLAAINAPTVAVLPGLGASDLQAIEEPDTHDFNFAGTTKSNHCLVTLPLLHFTSAFEQRLLALAETFEFVIWLVQEQSIDRRDRGKHRREDGPFRYIPPALVEVAGFGGGGRKWAISWRQAAFPGDAELQFTGAVPVDRKTILRMSRDAERKATNTVADQRLVLKLVRQVLRDADGKSVRSFKRNDCVRFSTPTTVSSADVTHARMALHAQRTDRSTGSGLLAGLFKRRR